MTIFDVIFELADLWCSWRVFLCVLPAILAACLLHDWLPESEWLWYVTVPGVLSALVGGIFWDYRASRRWGGL